MAVQPVNIVIEKGTDFSTTFKLKENGSPVNLGICTITSKMRKHYDALTSYNFTVTKLTPHTSGVIRVGMSTEITSTLSAGRYVYDVLLNTSGVTSKVIEGTVIVRGTAS